MLARGDNLQVLVHGLLENIAYFARPHQVIRQTVLLWNIEQGVHLRAAQVAVHENDFLSVKGKGDGDVCASCGSLAFSRRCK